MLIYLGIGVAVLLLLVLIVRAISNRTVTLDDGQETTHTLPMEGSRDGGDMGDTVLGDVEAALLGGARRALPEAAAAKPAAPKPAAATASEQEASASGSQDTPKPMAQASSEPASDAQPEGSKKQRGRRKRAGKGRSDGEAATPAKGDDEAASAPAAPEEPAAQPAAPARAALETSRSLSQGLERTKRDGFIGRLARLFKGRKELDEELLEQVEELLYKADIGVQTTEKLVELLKQASKKNDLGNPGAVWKFLKKETVRILDVPRPPFAAAQDRPTVILVVGVNGVGKTTTIGKIGARFASEGRRVLLAAGDTFRAAAVEQLEVWGERIGTEVVRGKPDADPASVIFNAVEKAVAESYDVVIADTAGRLHTKVPLMDELKKIHRVCTKAAPGAPDEVLLVLDSTNGQNAILQARQFREAIGLTGIVLTKLDGTAKGGIILGISDELGLPIRFIGIGEQAGDLRPFDPEEFVDALFVQEESA